MTQTAWGIKTGRVLLPFTIRIKRRDSIVALVTEMNFSPHVWRKVWAGAKRRGYSCVKVKLREVGDVKVEA